jgi:hypothetical protein
MKLQRLSTRTGPSRPLRIAVTAGLLTGVIALSPVSPFGATPAGAVDVWSAPIDLSAAADYTTTPQVASDPDGNAVAVWLKATVNDQTVPALCDALDKCVVQASQFNATTGAWTVPVTLSSDLENATQPDVVINSSGDAMAIWRRTTGADSVIQASINDGSGWQATPTDVSTNPSGSPRGPQVSVSSTDVFTVVWYRNQSASLNAVESRQYSGTTWSGVTVLSLGTNENAEISRVVADASGNVIAIWQGQLTLNGPFFVRASRFSGGVWSAPVSVSDGVVLDPADSTRNSLAPQIAISPVGNATAVWHEFDGTTTRIFTSRYTSGGTWSAPQILSAAGGNALNARVESDADGNVTALWRRFDAGGFSIIQTARYNATSGAWSTIIDLSSTLRQAQAQRLAVDSSGNATAVWRRNDANGNSIIQSARYSATTGAWGAARNLSDPGASALSPSTDVDENGNVIVAWSRTNAGGFPVIQSSRSTNVVGLGFVAITPTRVFDTRPGESPQALLSVSKTKVGGLYQLTVPMAALPGGLTPATGIGAVSLNVTAIDPDQDGFITVFPCSGVTEVSNVNFVAHQTVANAVIAPVSATGTVCFFSNTPAHILADINGYFPADSGYTAVAPKRVFDTRPGASTNALLTVPKARIGGTTELRVPMGSLPGGTTPASAELSAVSLNVTVSNPSASGFITVYPCGTRELVSSVNFVAGQTVANAVIAPVADNGDLCFFSNVSTDILVDISGWFPLASSYVAAENPVRVFDTRAGESANALRTVTKAKIGGVTELKVQMTNLDGVTPPLGVGAVSLNVTVTNPVGGGYVTVYPCGAKPFASSVNFVAGQTVANAVIAPLSPTGELCFFSNLDTDVLVDINGYFALD